MQKAILDRLSVAVEREVRQCLSRPLVLMFNDHASPAMTKQPLETMKLVLPSGALLVACFRGPDVQVKSLYFKDRVLRAPAQDRWRLLVRLLVRTSAVEQVGR